MRKLGPLQQRIYDFIKESGEIPSSDVYNKFSSYKKRAGERSGHFEMYRVKAVLVALESKGLIVYDQFYHKVAPTL